MWQRGSFAERHDRFERWTGCASLAHLEFNLSGNLKFPHSRLQQANGVLHHFARKNGRLSHLRQFLRVFSRPKPCHESIDPFELATAPGRFAKHTMLRNRQLTRVKPSPPNAGALQKFSNCSMEPRFVLQNMDS
jgi:hypothetical protein